MSVRILGVDPGLTRCGIGVIEALPGRTVRLVAVDVIRTAADMAPERRLLQIAQAFEEWIERYRPDAVAVERVFAQHNVRTVTGTSQVAGLAMVAATRVSVPVALHTPSEVKAAVTGSGRAEKAQVQEMVRRILGLEEAPSPADAADALAIAITHGWRGSATVVPMPGVQGQTAAQRAWAEAAAGTAARAQAARRRLAR
ncbi:crossover junction endodeoxyribonuclease RuvC [Pseudactinotalea suaedae]